MIRYTLLFLIMFLACFKAMSQSAQNLSLAIPSAPGSYQSDHFRAGDLDCSNAIGGGTNIEFGVMGVITQPNTASVISADPYTNQAKNIGVYGRIIIPLDKARERVNCNTLYQLELRKKQIEVQKLEEELRKLKNLQFENTKK